MLVRVVGLVEADEWRTEKLCCKVSGQVGGAALDVYEQEPARQNLLFGLEDVIATPHLGASTGEAQEKVAEQMAGQMADFLLTGIVTNAVNLPSVSPEEALRLQPYRQLADHAPARHDFVNE